MSALTYVLAAVGCWQVGSWVIAWLDKMHGRAKSKLRKATYSGRDSTACISCKEGWTTKGNLRCVVCEAERGE